MPRRIGDAWSSIRGIIRASLSFAQIKDLVGVAGLPIEKLSHMKQKFSGGSSKGQLMDGIDGLVNQLDEESKDRYVIACIEELLDINDNLFGDFNNALNRIGWSISENKEVYPIRLHFELETSNLSDDIQEGISKACTGIEMVILTELLLR